MTKWLVLLCLLAVFVAGCNPVALPFMVGEAIHKLFSPDPAKGGIGERTVLVLTFAPSKVLQVHPDLEYEVGSALTAEMKKAFPKATFVSARTLRDWQAKNPNWRGMLTPRIGKDLGADLVLDLNITRFRTREGGGSMIQQGVLAWEAQVVEAATEKRLWRMGEAEARWPKTARHILDDVPEARIKHRVMARFIDAFMGRFLDEFAG